jgi:hypothetical protein
MGWDIGFAGTIVGAMKANDISEHMAQKFKSLDGSRSNFSGKGL